jgi:hypothetical protein
MQAAIGSSRLVPEPSAVEHQTTNLGVGGSNLFGRAKYSHNISYLIN